MSSRLRLIPVALAILFVLGACFSSPTKVSLTCSSPDQNALTAQLPIPQSSGIELEISIDGTPSMLGYVSSGSTSRYSQTLNLIDGAATTVWPNPTTYYYRFGEGIPQKLKEDRSKFLKAKLPEFYNGSSDEFPKFHETLIDKAFPDASPNRLSVIVTDLYQKNADLNLLRQNLEEKYLKKGYAVGILGLRSEFFGGIYDIGIQADEFSWNSLDPKSGKQNPERFHPFYIILIGTYPNVVYYFNALKNNDTSSNLIQEDTFVIFYGNSVGKTAFLNPEESVEGKLPDGISFIETVNNGHVRVDTTDQHIEQLKINRKDTSGFPISYKIPLDPLLHTPPVAKLSHNIKYQFYDSVDKNFKSIENIQQLKLEELKPSGDQISFTIDLNPVALESGVHFFVIDTKPTDLVKPAWWETWNSGEEGRDGSKTHNFLNFMNGIKLDTTKLVENSLPVGRFCYLVQKDQ